MNEIEEYLPPHDLEAEEAVLGSVLIDPDALVYVRRILEPEHFYHRGNGLIYRAVLAVTDKQEPLDIVILIGQLRQMGYLDMIGGESAVINLMNAAPMSLYAEAYAGRVFACYQRRQMIGYASRLAKIAYQADEPTESASALVSEMMVDLRNGGAQEDTSANGAAGRYLDLIGNAETLERKLIRFHYPPIDKFFPDGGVFRGDLVGLMGPSSVGKTVVAAGLALRQAMAGLGVVYVSMEMSDSEIVHRYVQYLLGQQVSMRKHASGQVSMSANAQAVLKTCPLARYTGNPPTNLNEGVLRAAGFISKLPLIILDNSRERSISSISADIAALQAEQQIDTVYIDHMLLLEGDHKTGEATAASNLKNFRAMKNLAGRTDTVVVALTQMNMDGIKAGNRRPRMTDMYLGSGGFMNCNSIFALTAPINPETERAHPEGLMDIDAVKNRGGPTGFAKFSYNHPTFTIYDDILDGEGVEKLNGHVTVGLPV